MHRSGGSYIHRVHASVHIYAEQKGIVNFLKITLANLNFIALRIWQWLKASTIIKTSSIIMH